MSQHPTSRLRCIRYSIIVKGTTSRPDHQRHPPSSSYTFSSPAVVVHRESTKCPPKGDLLSFLPSFLPPAILCADKLNALDMDRGKEWVDDIIILPLLTKVEKPRRGKEFHLDTKGQYSSICRRAINLPSLDHDHVKRWVSILWRHNRLHSTWSISRGSLSKRKKNFILQWFSNQ